MFADSLNINELGIFNKRNLELLCIYCILIDDAKNNSYYTFEECKIIMQAKEALECNEKNTGDFFKIMNGLRVKIRHERYKKEIERLNNLENGLFAILLNKFGSDGKSPLITNSYQIETIEELKLIKNRWLVWSAFASLSSSALLELLENLQKLRKYIQYAKREVHENCNFHPSDYLTILILLQELENLADNTQNKLIETMLARINQVPFDDLIHLDNMPENKTYWDDPVLLTLNELVSLRLSSQFFQEFVKQTRPTKNLTVSNIKQFRKYILSFGTEMQKAEWEYHLQERQTKNKNFKLTITKNSLSPNHVVIFKEFFYRHFDQRKTDVHEQTHEKTIDPKFEEICDSQVEDNKSADSELSGINPMKISSARIDLAEKKTLYFPADAQAVELILDNNQICTYFQLLPDPPLTAYLQNEHELSQLEYNFSTSESNKALIEAKKYFSEKKHQQIFVKKIQTCMCLCSSTTTEHIKDFVNASFKETADIIIGENAALFGDLECGRVKENFIKRAQKLEIQFSSIEPMTSFEDSVLNRAYSEVVAIEKKSNTIYRQLCAKGLTLNTAQYYRDIFSQLVYRILDNQDNPNADIDSIITIAKKVIDFIYFLQKERERIESKRWMMKKSVTERKLGALTGIMDKLSSVKNNKEFEDLKNSMLTNVAIIAKRGFFSLPWIPSKIKQHLNYQINHRFHHS